jgi:acetyl-CoA/propionyl-CoA carboxylase biotin carboxyl carrier protein
VFRRVLVANRGEIAVRVIQTLRRLGVPSAAVFTDPDAGALHTRMADVAVALGPARAYLDPDALVEAARRAGADAVHPGYGFLSENADFARACLSAGLTFIGPPADAIDAMGDKIRARRLVSASGVPVVPGADGDGLDDDGIVLAAVEVGLPVLLKPSAGGGGKGMRAVTSEADLPAAVAAARREALSAFGDGTLLVERLIERPRHIEVQVFADGQGTVVSLGERECTLQRRHQKIVEEAPSPFLDPHTRQAMASAAVEAARSCGYVGAGTVEFIVASARPSEFFFMEMNTRLQVEHPVTEEVLGIDLVELQLRVAAGEPLPWAGQAEVPAPKGHAVEARIYAEDPGRGFLPSAGPVLLAELAAGRPGIRVDSALMAGTEVTTDYDPMLAKVIAVGGGRDEALDRLVAALRETAVLGLSTNTGFLVRLLSDPDVRRGDIDTGLVERGLDALGAQEIPAEVLAAAAVARPLLSVPQRAAGPWLAADGWRLSGSLPVRGRLWVDGRSFEVSRSGRHLTIGTDTWEVGAADVAGRRLEMELDGVVHRLPLAPDPGGGFWVGLDGDAWLVGPEQVIAGGGRGAVGAGGVLSPMPGTVLSVHVEDGQSVEAGQALVTVEAMKMEYTLVAPGACQVVSVLVVPGSSVARDEPLVVLGPAGSDAAAPEGATGG